MVKSSILFALLLGVVFAQMVPAFSSNLDSEANDSDGDADDGDESDTNEAEEETDDEGSALTCLLFENLGCNTECSMIAGAFSLEGTGKCTEENVCQCTIKQYDTLEGLFRSKFNAEDALKKIKNDNDLSAKVLEILQVPFQSIVQTKRQLREVVSPAIYDQLLINDKTPAWKLGLIGETDKLNHDKIKEFVSDKLKPVLKSSSKQLIGVNYNSNMKKSLEGNTNEDLHNIINQVRRTKNKNLNDIVDNYLKSAKIKEEKGTEEDDLADAIGYQIIDQFVNHIEEKKKPATKKSARKPSPRNAKKSNPADKKPKKQEKSENSKKSSNTKDKTKKKSKDSSATRRFELPNFDKNFLNKNGGGRMSETFQNEYYTLQYSKSGGGSIDFTWKKGNDQVYMNISSGGSISQVWHLDDASIALYLSSGGSINQTWIFKYTRYTYSKSSGGNLFRNWTNNIEDSESLKKFKRLINEWCNENDFLLVHKKQCIIY